MSRLPVGRLARAAAWTLVFGAGLLALDRLVLGPRPMVGWRRVATIGDVPAGSGSVVVPAYLPKGLAWPPAQVWVCDHDHPGWWVWSPSSVHSGEGMWIGVGDDDPPAALGELRGCLLDPTVGECPEGWQGLSTRLDSGVSLNLVARLEPSELARVVEGLRIASH